MVRKVLAVSSRTVVVVVSDHGDKEQSRLSRLFFPDTYALRTPLFIRLPPDAVSSKQSSHLAANALNAHRPVTNLDVFPTVATLLNYDLTKLPTMNHTIRGQVKWLYASFMHAYIRELSSSQAFLGTHSLIH